MKIYKLDIDTSKPTRQIVAMQQNSTGLLSVNVTNDGKYIRNLSCSVYDGENEISATTANGYKIDIGTGNKAIKVVAKSEPIISMNQYIAHVVSGTRLRSVTLNKVQIPPGVYDQDEFAFLTSLVSKDDIQAGMRVNLAVPISDLSATNFSQIILTPLYPFPEVRVDFMQTTNGQTRLLPPDEQISASEEISVCTSQTIKCNSFTLSAVPYYSVGHWTDYQKHTVITPSTNAPCYAEQDVEEPAEETPVAELSSDE